jgi:hypothetical protein
MNYRVVSYYTRNTIYEVIMLNYLLPCLELLKMPNAIYAIEDTGKWEINASFQPSIIWRAMKTWPNDAILWLDSDIIIRAYPHLFDEIPNRCDIGLYYMDYADHYNANPPHGIKMPKPILNTGVIWFNNTPKTLLLVEEWMERTSKDLKKSHRIHLEELIDDHLKDDLSFFLIPRSHAYVAETDDHSLPAIPMKEPIIVQFAASAWGKKNLYDAKPFVGEQNAS